ncbi:MAG: hypothetical protein RSB39_08075 [Oscillospiraceae bacterium]
MENVKVGFGVGQGNFAINLRQRSTLQDNSTSAEQSRTRRGDSVTISPQGRKNSLLDNLIKQKTRITDQKNSLISSTLEKGDTLDTIKSLLESYEEQAKNIDNQIAQLMAEEMAKQAEKQEKPDDNKPKTKEEIQNERLAGITSLSGDLQQAKTISAAQTTVSGDARVLKSEIELDKMSAGSSDGAKTIISKKETALAGIEQKALNLTSQVADKLSDITEKIDEINKPQEVLPDDEVKDDVNTDEAEPESDKTNPSDKLSPADTKDENLEKSEFEDENTSAAE